jgi:hypothetical protein
MSASHNQACHYKKQLKNKANPKKQCKKQAKINPRKNPLLIKEENLHRVRVKRAVKQQTPSF